MTPTIIILALIAAFLGLRLYSVLGKHGRDSNPRCRMRRIAAPFRWPSRLRQSLMHRVPPLPAQGMVYEPAAEIGIRSILSADRAFDVGRFVNGSKAAYRMILEAYWKGDRELLRTLCDADSYEAFDAAITGREARGETLENRLISIENATIVSAALNGKTARVAVRFEADIAAITRDADGRVIAGSMSDAVGTQDVWSFVRDVDAAGPEWLLDETDAE